VGDRSAGVSICDTTIRGLNDVEMVEHIVQAAVVWKTVEKGPNGVFGGHGNPAWKKVRRVYDRIGIGPSPRERPQTVIQQARQYGC
jgi:hypothetical protein